jgi:hypothetical protein
MFHCTDRLWQLFKHLFKQGHFLFLNAPKVLALAAPRAKLLVNPIFDELLSTLFAGYF